jgi:hypothetical protein
MSHAANPHHTNTGHHARAVRCSAVRQANSGMEQAQHDNGLRSEAARSTGATATFASFATTYWLPRAESLTSSARSTRPHLHLLGLTFPEPASDGFSARPRAGPRTTVTSGPVWLDISRITADILQCCAERHHGAWHDRAAYHFLTI